METAEDLSIDLLGVNTCIHANFSHCLAKFRNSMLKVKWGRNKAVEKIKPKKNKF